MDAPCRELISWIVLSILLTTELEIGEGVMDGFCVWKFRFYQVTGFRIIGL